MALSKMSLLDLDETTMGKLMNYMEFKSIIRLRRVCHDLRNFIDDKKPDIKLLKLEVACMRGRMLQSIYTTDFNCFYSTYINDGLNCIIKGHEYSRPKKELAKTDYFPLFFKDFEMHSSSQKSVLDVFDVSFLDYEEPEKFFKELDKILSARPDRIRVKRMKIELRGQDQGDVLSIVHQIDPKSLVDIKIRSSLEELDISDMVQTEHFKLAKTVEIIGSCISVSLDKFFHFSEVRIRLKSISSEEVKQLTETIIAQSHITSFRIDALTLARPTQLQTLLGPPGIVSHGSERCSWIFQLDGSDKVLKLFTSCPSPIGYFKQPMSLIWFEKDLLENPWKQKVDPTFSTLFNGY